jgi:hypothetical protein
MKLPGIDGWTVLKWLKETKIFSTSLFMLCLALEKCLKMGAFDFLGNQLLRKAKRSIQIYRQPN